jgi:hypothetical protein
VLKSDFTFPAHQYARPLDDVAQLADVSRPGMLAQDLCWFWSQGVVIVDGNYGIRITEVVDARERIRTI